MAPFISYQQTSGGPSNLTPVPGASGPISPPWRETSGFVGSLRQSKKPPGNAASRSASIRCGEACAGRAVGRDALTAEGCPDDALLPRSLAIRNEPSSQTMEPTAPEPKDRDDVCHDTLHWLISFSLDLPFSLRASRRGLVVADCLSR